MRVFTTVRKLLPLIGLLRSHQPTQRIFLTNAQRIFVYISIIYGAVTAMWFIVFEADTVDGLAKATSSFVIYMYAFMVFTVVIFSQELLLAMFHDLESTIAKRK